MYETGSRDDPSSRNTKQRAEAHEPWSKAVEPKYRKIARQVIRGVKRYQGQVVATSEHVARNARMPKDTWQPPEALTDLSVHDAEFGFRMSRDVLTEKLYVVIYIRVSTSGQT